MAFNQIDIVQRSANNEQNSLIESIRLSKRQLSSVARMREDTSARTAEHHAYVLTYLFRGYSNTPTLTERRTNR